ncbi:hypothetical protein QMZ92_04420 [Streptomyces sp. HNM0645]|uniref:hypothetical protein n=1 Tax=Streptomyces sp. HNM0645 TaxID=2782343 RepID=UPI0024B7B575|nr:hypothetical protein [Streptomyces sp. HNM0645]MDI9883662.1 hypothetical protein [Streptomyces sp. HNM0645]
MTAHGPGTDPGRTGTKGGWGAESVLVGLSARRTWNHCHQGGDLTGVDLDHPRPEPVRRAMVMSPR